MKVAFLVAITSMKRVGEFHARSVSSECYRMDPVGRSTSLLLNPLFLPKVLSDRHVNIPFILSAYDPPLRHAVAAYVERTQSVRTDQIFVCYDESPGGWAIKVEALSLDRGNDYDSISPSWDLWWHIQHEVLVCPGLYCEECPH